MKIVAQRDQQVSLKTYGSEGETEREFESSPEYLLSLTQLLEQQGETIHTQLLGATGPNQEVSIYAPEQGELSVSV